MSAIAENQIAVIGMSCRFAGAANLRSFWLSVLSARPAFSDLEDAAAGRFLSEDPSSFRRIPTLRAALLGDLWRTAGPQTAAVPNPVMVLAADLAAEALKDSARQDGGAQGAARGRVCLSIGHSPGLGPAEAAWCQHGFVIDQTMDLIRRCLPYGSAADFESLRRSLDAALPQFDARSAKYLLPQTLATHVAGRCNISGQACCFDAGDASSAAAIQAGRDALLAGRADLALAGAVQGPVSAPLEMPFAKMGLLSRGGELRPFCNGADGTLLGEGGGFLAMKRLEDAIRDGDRIYATVGGVATAPGGNAHRIDGGYADAIRAAAPAQGPFPEIGLLEANGNGVAALDKAELRTFCSTAAAGAAKRDSIALGAVKALVGDCLAAAGIAGAIKAILAIHNRIIPPALPQQLIQSAIDLSGTPLYLPQHPRPWVHDDNGAPRRAAVASIGLGGNASFMIFEQVRR